MNNIKFLYLLIGFSAFASPKKVKASDDPCAKHVCGRVVELIEGDADGHRKLPIGATLKKMISENFHKGQAKPTNNPTAVDDKIEAGAFGSELLATYGAFKAQSQGNVNYIVVSSDKTVRDAIKDEPNVTLINSDPISYKNFRNNGGLADIAAKMRASKNCGLNDVILSERHIFADADEAGFHFGGLDLSEGFISPADAKGLKNMRDYFPGLITHTFSSTCFAPKTSQLLDNGLDSEVGEQDECACGAFGTSPTNLLPATFTGEFEGTPNGAAIVASIKTTNPNAKEPSPLLFIGTESMAEFSGLSIKYSYAKLAPGAGSHLLSVYDFTAKPNPLDVFSWNSADVFAANIIAKHFNKTRSVTTEKDPESFYDDWAIASEEALQAGLDNVKTDNQQTHDIQSSIDTLFEQQSRKYARAVADDPLENRRVRPDKYIEAAERVYTDLKIPAAIDTINAARAAHPELRELYGKVFDFVTNRQQIFRSGNGSEANLTNLSNQLLDAGQNLQGLKAGLLNGGGDVSALADALSSFSLFINEYKMFMFQYYFNHYAMQTFTKRKRLMQAALAILKNEVKEGAKDAAKNLKRFERFLSCLTNVPVGPMADLPKPRGSMAISVPDKNHPSLR